MCPALERERPDLAAVCARRREHTVVAALPDERNALLDAAGEQEPADSATRKAEFDRLAGELEGHLVYEEEHLVPLLTAARLSRAVSPTAERRARRPSAGE